MVGAVGRVASIRHCERLTLLTNAAALHAHSLNESSLQLSSATRDSRYPRPLFCF